jgi:hypothetical protein
VVGASDDKGMLVAERAVTPANLLGTFYQLLGIDPEGPLPNDRGLDVSVMAGSKDGEGLLHEII